MLTKQGLHPRINRYVLTETSRGNIWLFVVMEKSDWEFYEAYAATNVLSYFSTVLHGHRVVFSNSYGLRYAVLLSQSQNLLKFTPSLPSSL
jgi:hypothetical protein